MIDAFKRSNFLSVSLKNSSQVIVRVFIGLLNIKVIALVIGPNGLAMVSQLQSFLQLSVNLAGAGINNGIIKLVSKNADDKATKQSIINTSFAVVIAFSLTISLLALCFSNKISVYLFNSANYSFLIFCSGIYIITTSLFNVFLSIINGLQKLGVFISLNVAYFISGFIVFCFGIYFFGLSGALWAMLFQSFIALLICIFKMSQLGGMPKVRLSKVIIQKLSKFSLMALVSGIITPIVVLSVRKVIIVNLSLNEAGIWDGVFKISSSYINLATLPFSYYFLPTFSKLSNSVQIRNEIKHAFLILIPLLVLGGFLIFICRDIIIQIMLSNDFNEASSIMKWQIIGDGFKVLCWLIGTLLIAKEKVTAFILTELMSGVLFVGISYYLIPKMGIEGSALAYLIENVLSFIILIFIFLILAKKQKS